MLLIRHDSVGTNSPSLVWQRRKILLFNSFYILRLSKLTRCGNKPLLFDRSLAIHVFQII